MKVAFLTLGCKVNFYETEKMMEQFQKKGFEVVEFAEQADIYVINTCTVTNIADRKSRQMIHRAKKKNPDAKVVAVGCYVESGGEQLLQDHAIDAAFSNKEKGGVANQVIEKFHLQISDLDRGSQVYDFEHERTRAYIKIQDGCNQFCTYCLIPYVRGNGELTSMPEEEVLQQVQMLAEKGFQEVVLTGIHLSSYGVTEWDARNFVELEGKPLISLLEKVNQIEGIRRIRLGSLEPRIICENFLRDLVKITKICPHFHLSLQSGCDSVLGRMNRHYSTTDYEKTVALLRKYFEHPAITTDVIVGFPGETDEEFEMTRKYLKKIRLADIHVFKYSKRDGTIAARREDQVRPEVKNKRSECLMNDVYGYRREYCEQFIGKSEFVLFEEIVEEDGIEYLVGHNERYVKIGVLLSEAREKMYHENEIHSVLVEKVMKK